MLAFALWDIVKMVLLLVTSAPGAEDGGTADALETALGGRYELLLAVIALALVLLVFGALPLRIHIGRAARAEGLGRARRRAYVPLAFVFGAFQLLLLAVQIWGALFSGDAPQPLPQALASLLLESCSTVTTFETGVTALKLRRLKRRLGEAG